MDEKILPETSVGLAFVADEETSSHWGLDYVLQHPLNPFKKEDLIVVPDSGEPDGSAIEIAEKSILWLRFKTKGVQCHGSRPALGKNAFLASSYLIVELQSLYKKYGSHENHYSTHRRAPFNQRERRPISPVSIPFPEKTPFSWILVFYPNTI